MAGSNQLSKAHLAFGFASTLLRRASWIGILLVVSIGSFPRVVLGDDLLFEDSPVALGTPKVLGKKLTRPASLLSDNQPLWVALAQIRETHQIALWLDRRIDRNKIMQINSRANRLLDLIKEVAASADAEVAIVEDVVYVCPKGKARTIEAAYWRAFHSMKKNTKGATTSEAAKETRTLRWAAFSNPQQILSEVEKEWGVSIEGQEVLEHDVWAAGGLEAMTLPAQLTLILSGFDQATEMEADGKSWRVVRQPSKTKIEVRYPPSLISKEQLASVKKEFKLDSRTAGQDQVVQAEGIAHFALICMGNVPKSNDSARNNNLGRAMIKSFEVANTPAMNVFEQVAKQLGLTPKWNIPDGYLANTLITTKVENVTVTAMLNDLAQKAKVKVTIQEQELLIEAAAE